MCPASFLPATINYTFDYPLANLTIATVLIFQSVLTPNVRDNGGFSLESTRATIKYNQLNQLFDNLGIISSY